VVFTTALFLSGYAIQQRTLRDLRAAIRPDARPSPKVYLPDGFKVSTTELEDRTVVYLDAGERDPEPSQQETIIDIKPTISGEAEPNVEKLEPDGSQKPQDGPEQQHEQAAEKQKHGAEEDIISEDIALPKPLSRFERRRQIKEEIRRLSQGESPVYYQRRLW
jgi:hypothetical protein